MKDKDIKILSYIPESLVPDLIEEVLALPEVQERLKPANQDNMSKEEAEETIKAWAKSESAKSNQNKK